MRLSTRSTTTGETFAPDANVWNGAFVEVVLTLTAYREPYDVRLRFGDCDEINLGVNGQFTAPDIFDLTFEFLGRGTLMDGVTPLTPWVCVAFETGAGIGMNLRCFSVRAERVPGPSRKY